MDFENETLVNVKLFTKYEQYQMGTSAIGLPARFGRMELSKLVNEALELEKPTPFDFIVKGKLLRTSISEYMSLNGISTETTIDLEYVPIIGKPEEKSSEDLPDWVSSIACCDSCYVAGCYDGSVHVYSNDDTLITKKQIHKRPIKGIDCQIIDTIPYITSVSLDNSLHLMKLENNIIEDITTLKGHHSHVLCCKINPTLGLAVSGAWNGSIHVWDIKDEKETEPVHSLLESKEGITAVTWWGANVVSGGWDHIVRIWDLETEGMLSDMKGTKVINSLDVNESLKVIATGHPDGATRLWDSRQEHCNVLTLMNRREFTSSVAWHPTNTNLISCTDYTGCVTVYDIRSTFPLHIAEHVHKGKILASTWKNEDILLTGGEDKKLKRLSVNRKD